MRPFFLSAKKEKISVFYYDLIEFVNVKPLDDWKDHIEEYHKDVLSK